MCGPNTKLLGFYVMKSAQTHFMSLSQQQGFIQMECWKRWRGDITLTLTNGRAQLHSCSTYQRKRSACEFCASVRTYCIQTTGSFSVAPPSLESDLMVLEPKIGFWNMFHSAYCLKVDYAVTRIVSSFLWIEIQYYNHPKKNMFYILQDRMSRRNVIKCCIFVTDSLNSVTCAKTKWRVFPPHNRWDKFFVEFVNAHCKCQPFTIPLVCPENDKPMKGLRQEDMVNQDLITELRKEFSMTHDDFYMVLTDTDMRVKVGSFALLSCSICFKIEFPNTSITACLNQKV